jgi:hypothetical protein
MCLTVFKPCTMYMCVKIKDHLWCMPVISATQEDRGLRLAQGKNMSSSLKTKFKKARRCGSSSTAPVSQA